MPDSPRRRGTAALLRGAVMACAMLVVAVAGGAQDTGGDGLQAVRTFEPGELRVADLGPLQRVVVVEGGRTMPLDSYARFTLLRLSGRRSLDRRPAIEWLARVLFTPNETHDDQIFVVDNPEVIDAMGLPSRGRDRYSLSFLLPGLDELERLAEDAAAIGEDNRTIVEREIIRLWNNVGVYANLLSSFAFTYPHRDFQVDDAGVAELLGLPGPGTYSYLDISLRRSELREAATAAGVGARHERGVQPRGRTAASAQPEPGCVGEQFRRVAAGDHTGRRLRRRAVAHAVAGTRRSADGGARGGAGGRDGERIAGAARLAGCLPGGTRSAVCPGHPPVQRLRAAARGGRPEHQESGAGDSLQSHQSLPGRSHGVRRRAAAAGAVVRRLAQMAVSRQPGAAGGRLHPPYLRPGAAHPDYRPAAGYQPVRDVRVRGVGGCAVRDRDGVPAQALSWRVQRLGRRLRVPAAVGQVRRRRHHAGACRRCWTPTSGCPPT